MRKHLLWLIGLGGLLFAGVLIVSAISRQEARQSAPETARISSSLQVTSTEDVLSDGQSTSSTQDQDDENDPEGDGLDGN